MSVGAWHRGMRSHIHSRVTRQPLPTDPRATPPALESAALVHAADAPRRYAPPRLVTFGTVAEITATVGRRGKRDGKRSFRRTGF